jgi:hypothetical protein
VLSPATAAIADAINITPVRYAPIFVVIKEVDFRFMIATSL